MNIEDLVEEEQTEDETELEEADDEAQTDGDEEVQLSETEQRAYDRGWRPKEEWVESRGTEAGWHSAEEFLEFGDPTAMRRKFAAMQRQIDAGTRAQKEQQKAFEKGLDMQRSALERQYDEKMRAAVEDGDVDEFDKLTQEKAEAVGKLEEKPEETPEGDPDAVEWLANNPWMEIDEAANKLANVAFMAHQKRNPDAPVIESLEAAEKRVRTKFPQYFDDEKAEEITTKSKKNGKERTMADLKVASGNRKGAPKQKSPSASLSEAEKMAAQALVRRGVFKDVDEYATALAAENAKQEARM